ncbi:MAG: two pore domain potassium channel family protein [Caldilineaceae bacterium]|nr:two pore domain potassium channel family protein [Caldilineaceae bacterium]
MAGSERSKRQEQKSADQVEQIVIHAHYQLFVLAMSLIQVANSFLIVVLDTEAAVRIALAVNVVIIAPFLFADAVYRIWKMPDRRFLLDFHGYLVVIGSIPFPFTGIFRIIWFWLATRRLQRTDFEDIERVVIRKSAQSAMLAVLLAALLVLEISSILIIETEHDAPNANILTADDAMWWSFVTIATVGYGDKYPVTTEGRFVALFAMIVGVGIFTVMTSFFAQTFIEQRQKQDRIDYLDSGPTHSDPHASW